jgi:hypothetical protein
MEIVISTDKWSKLVDTSETRQPKGSNVYLLARRQDLERSRRKLHLPSLPAASPPR